MQRRLILMRHAKSSWADPGQSDHERPLNERGRGDAPRVAQHLTVIGWTPDAAVASDSVRTLETFERMAPHLLPRVHLEVVPSLYLGDLVDIRRSAANWPAAWRCVLVLGHNPGMEEAVEELTGRREAMKTANAALLECDLDGDDWSLALTERWNLREVVRPKTLRGDDD